MDLDLLAAMPSWQWPADAGNAILAVLRNREASDRERLLAAELGGDYVVVNDEIAGELLHVLCNSEESEELRGRAAIALGPALESADTDGLDDFDNVPISEGKFHEIKDTLKRLYKDPGVPKYVRRRILEASVRAPQDWNSDAVRAAYTTGDGDWVMTAVFCMQFLRGFDREILEALNHADPVVRAHALEAAGNSEVKGAWPHVAALLKSPKTDKDLLLAAIEAAPFINPEEAPHLLVDLAHHSDEDIAGAAYEALTFAQGEQSMMDDDDDSC